MRNMVEELIVHTVLLVLMAVLFWESRSFPEVNVGGNLGSAWWPQITLGLGMVLTVASAATVVRRSLREPDASGLVSAQELQSLALSSGIFCIFLLLLGVVGFLGALPVLMFGFLYQLGARKWPVLVLVPIVSSPLFALIFGRFMEVPLPRGAGWARVLSFYVY